MTRRHRRHHTTWSRGQDLRPGTLNARLAAAGPAYDARHIEGRLQTVGQMAVAERPSLRPLPAAQFDPIDPLTARVDRKARIWVSGSHCSVPVRLAGREVAVALGGTTLTVRAGDLMTTIGWGQFRSSRWSPIGLSHPTAGLADVVLLGVTWRGAMAVVARSRCEVRSTRWDIPFRESSSNP